MKMEDTELTPQEWLDAVKREGFVMDEPLTHPDPSFAADLEERMQRREVSHAMVSSLKALRQAAGLNQTEVGARWNRPQSYVSAVERNPSKVEIATLAGYVRALGGSLTITVKAGDTTYIEDLVDAPDRRG